MTVSLPLLTNMQNYLQAQQVLNDAQLIFTAEQVQQAIIQLAEKINARFSDVSEPVIVLPVMNGGLILSGQLITRFNFPLLIDYCHATRYRDETTGSQLQWIVKPQNNLAGRTILIIDDIFDEGYTLKSVTEFCQTENAQQVLSAVLLEKNHPRKTADLKSDFIGLQVEDRYVFGFGMDFKGFHRQLDAIYAVAE